MYFLKCEHRGCRQENHLVVCDGCGLLVCPAHSTPIGYPDKRRCYDCAKPPRPLPEPQQLDLFSRVRPRPGSKSAHDGLIPHDEGRATWQR